LSTRGLTLIVEGLVTVRVTATLSGLVPGTVIVIVPL
jgi:hypothetical protein